MLTSLIDGLLLVLQWPAVGFLCLGTLAGVWLGAVPGVSGIVGMVIVLPFTFDMDPVSAFTLLLAIFAVTSTGDTLSAILLGVPGTASAAATVIDGYPLARQGQAERAFGAAFAVSMVGGVIGAVILALSLPVIRPLILSFGSPEFFMLGLLGLTMVGALAGSSMLKGLGAGGLGLLLSMIGYAPASPVPRYWFDQVFLLEGLPLIAVVLGLFAIPEVVGLAVKQWSISDVSIDQSRGGGLRQGIRDAIREWWLVVRCSAIGVYIGILPGLGAAIVDWVAYGHTVQSSRDKSGFGKGDIRGVIGPEAANNAVRGGALIPTLAFGIPGSSSMAILLGALLIHGMRPGEQMLVEKLDITYSMVWTIILANILAAVVLMMASRSIAKVAFIPGHFIVPGVMVLMLMAAWLELPHLGGWVITILAGFLGLWLKAAGWPRPPLLLGFILGPIMESGFRLSTQAFGTFGWLTRPIVMLIGVAIVVILIWSMLAQMKKAPTEESRSVGEGYDGNPLLSLCLGLLLLVVFAGAAAMALEWRPSARQFPLAIALPTMVILCLLLWHDGRAVTLQAKTSGRWPLATGNSESIIFWRGLLFFAMVSGAVAMATLIGQQFALPLYVLCYLVIWARVGIGTALIYSGTTLAVLLGFYGELLHTAWLRPVINLRSLW